MYVCIEQITKLLQGKTEELFNIFRRRVKQNKTKNTNQLFY